MTTMTTEEQVARVQALLPASRRTGSTSRAAEARWLRAVLITTLATFIAFFGAAIVADPPAVDGTSNQVTFVQYRNGPAVAQPHIRTRTS